MAINEVKSSFTLPTRLSCEDFTAAFERFVDPVRPIFRRSLAKVDPPAMTIFRLKQMASTSAHAVAGAVRWNYDRAELIADGIVHAIGVFGGLIAATVLLVSAGVCGAALE